jgi:hypothetical protein
VKSIRVCGVLLGVALLIGVGVVILVWLFRNPTPEERDNRRALDVILTAITLKNPRLLEESSKRAKARYDAGQLTNQEYQGMEAFINKARGGDWQGAEKDGYEFRKRHPFVREGQ